MNKSKCGDCKYNTNSYVCHPNCGGCDGQSNYISREIAKRFGFNISDTQFFIIPSVGITHKASNCRFAIAFAWFNLLFCIRFFRYVEVSE
ncbi:MAG: hypothetical protein M0R40_00550 [Firmicutes bacterium]|nr:hypothetical protein [Bacillota bacterium]